MEENTKDPDWKSKLKVLTGIPVIKEKNAKPRFPTLDMSENGESQVKIEDQGNFIIHETPRSLSENNTTPQKVEESKQRHLFYMKNIHIDDQDLSNLNDNDYLNFYNNDQINVDPREELRNLLCPSANPVSLNSSKGLPDLALETYNFNQSYVEGDSQRSYDLFADNVEENMLTTFIVKDTSQESLTEREPEPPEKSPLAQENQMLKAKVAFQNKVISILKEKVSDLNVVKDLRSQLKATTEENGALKEKYIQAKEESIKNLELLHSQMKKDQENISIKNKLEERVEQLESIKRKLEIELDNKTNLMPRSIKISSPRQIFLQDSQKGIGNTSSKSLFGKKWSLASKKEVDPDTQILHQFLITLNKMLNDFKYPDRINSIKSKLFKNNWKVKINDMDQNEILASIVCRISALIKACEKISRCHPNKNKSIKPNLSSNRTLGDNYETKTSALSSYLTNPIYSPPKTIYPKSHLNIQKMSKNSKSPSFRSYQNYNLKIINKSKPKSKASHPKKVTLKYSRNKPAPGTSVTSKRVSKSTTEVNSIDEKHRKPRIEKFAHIKKLEKIPSNICMKLSLKKMQKSKQSTKKNLK
ncbi:unnamed protein product [Moneuplotes crassus]|uniref:Uncharacterized protein n=1 Tax=Euplotes crassus TaxID=5936 RepID=A0AAD2DAP8_EUPCR|nr:unnamed protein product [Moneuplotes crassus]